MLQSMGSQELDTTERLNDNSNEETLLFTAWKQLSKQRARELSSVLSPCELHPHPHVRAEAWRVQAQGPQRAGRP